MANDSRWFERHQGLFEPLPDIGFDLASGWQCTETDRIENRVSSRSRGAGVMNLPRRRFLQLTAGAVALPAVSSRSAWAQAYPTRPITIIVAYAAGGTTDIIARVMAERMRVTLGQAVVVENVTGAKRSPPCKKPKSKSGIRSSRLRTSSWNRPCRRECYRFGAASGSPPS